MNLKLTPYNELHKAILVAFEGDDKIKDFYDPKVEVSLVTDIVDDVLRKIKDYEDQMEISSYSVYEKDVLIGYVVKSGNHLISFGISTKYRTKENLKTFFNLIKNKVGENLFTFLWCKNVRAVKWLIKNGLRVTYFDNNIIKLQCQ